MNYSTQSKELYCVERSSDTEATKDSLKRSTMELLQSIEKLNTFEDVLKESEVLPQICITYYEEVTPLDYQPPGFRSPDASSQNMIDVISDMSKNPMIMGVLKTGFHTMQCLGKFARIREESDSTDISLGENERIPLSQITDQISDLEVTPKNQLSTNLKKDSGLGDNLQVDCLCLINGKFKNISLIECTNCTFLEHAPCVGYFEASDVEKPYYCQKCKYITSTSSTPRDLRRQHVLAIYRLSLTYMYLNKVFPSEVLNNVKESVRLLIVKRLSLLKVIEETADGYLLVNEDILKPSIKKLFENRLARIKSKNVITSEENEDVSPAKKIKIA